LHIAGYYPYICVVQLLVWPGIRQRLQWVTSRIHGVNDTVTPLSMQNSHVKGSSTDTVGVQLSVCKKMQTKLLSVANHVQKVYFYVKSYITVI
jgi:hypothetical protein